jgi:hypothetical protein
MQNLLVHVACHPRQKHLMYVRGKINLSDREREVLGGVVSTYKVDFRVPWVRNVLLGSTKHGKCVFLVLISA